MLLVPSFVRESFQELMLAAVTVMSLVALIDPTFLAMAEVRRPEFSSA
jgi:hypothetical protein